MKTTITDSYLLLEGDDSLLEKAVDIVKKLEAGGLLENGRILKTKGFDSVKLTVALTSMFSDIQWNVFRTFPVMAEWINGQYIVQVTHHPAKIPAGHVLTDDDVCPRFN